MSAQASRCPKCGEEMSAAFLVDSVTGFKRRTVPVCIDGEAIWSALWGYLTKDRGRWFVSVYRCKGCGFLESYAKTPAE
jgi:hypothetical protein